MISAPLTGELSASDRPALARALAAAGDTLRALATAVSASIAAGERPLPIRVLGRIALLARAAAMTGARAAAALGEEEAGVASVLDQTHYGDVVAGIARSILAHVSSPSRDTRAIATVLCRGAPAGDLYRWLWEPAPLDDVIPADAAALLTAARVAIFRHVAERTLAMVTQPGPGEARGSLVRLLTAATSPAGHAATSPAGCPPPSWEPTARAWPERPLASGDVDAGVDVDAEMDALEAVRKLRDVALASAHAPTPVGCCALLSALAEAMAAAEDAGEE